MYHFGGNDTSSDMGYVPPASSAGWRVRARPPPIGQSGAFGPAVKARATHGWRRVSSLRSGRAAYPRP